jgi:hypothetical protein
MFFEPQSSKESSVAGVFSTSAVRVDYWFSEKSFIKPSSSSLHHLPDEVQAIATLIEKQAQIVVKPRMVSERRSREKLPCWPSMLM